MTTNKTFLTLLLLGLSYTAYNAAAVSENFEISTPIDHEIVLSNIKSASTDAGLNVTGDINLGTIVINPDYTGGYTLWTYDEQGNINYPTGKGIVSAPNAQVGYFTANIPNPHACDTPDYACGGLRVVGDDGIDYILGMFTGEYFSDSCAFNIQYTGNDNRFKVYPSSCTMPADMSKVTQGNHSRNLPISYTPEA